MNDQYQQFAKIKEKLVNDIELKVNLINPKDKNQKLTKAELEVLGIDDVNSYFETIMAKVEKLGIEGIILFKNLII